MINNLVTQDQLNKNVSDLNTNLNTAVNGLTTDINAKQDKLTNPLVRADLVNTLTSTSTTKPLAAAQGKALEDGKSNKLKRTSKSTSFTVKTSDTAWSITDNQSGWTPVMFSISYSNVSNVYCGPEKVTFSDGSIKVEGYAKHISASTSMSVTLHTLWVQN